MTDNNYIDILSNAVSTIGNDNSTPNDKEGAINNVLNNSPDGSLIAIIKPCLNNPATVSTDALSKAIIEYIKNRVGNGNTDDLGSELYMAAYILKSKLPNDKFNAINETIRRSNVDAVWKTNWNTGGLRAQSNNTASQPTQTTTTNIPIADIASQLRTCIYNSIQLTDNTTVSINGQNFTIKALREQYPAAFTNQRVDGFENLLLYTCTMKPHLDVAPLFAGQELKSEYFENLLQYTRLPQNLNSQQKKQVMKNYRFLLLKFAEQNPKDCLGYITTHASQRVNTNPPLTKEDIETYFIEPLNKIMASNPPIDINTSSFNQRNKEGLLYIYNSLKGDPKYKDLTDKMAKMLGIDQNQQTTPANNPTNAPTPSNAPPSRPSKAPTNRPQSRRHTPATSPTTTPTPTNVPTPKPEQQSFWDKKFLGLSVRAWAWIIGGLLVGGLAYGAFRKGGWLNKDKGKSKLSSIASSGQSTGQGSTGSSQTPTLPTYQDSVTQQPGTGSTLQTAGSVLTATSITGGVPPSHTR